MKRSEIRERHHNFPYFASLHTGYVRRINMLQTYKDQLPDYAKDLKLNLTQVLSESPSSELSNQQITGVALAVAYATRNRQLIELIFQKAEAELDESTLQAIKAAASIMAMNNIYYRFVHLVKDSEYQRLPANLRMNIIANPGIDKKDFELYSLAVSAINGCGLCIDAHANTLIKSGLSKHSIQHVIRIAAVLNGLAQVSIIENKT
ncbi:peroxiredoxin reductase (NAD(P)H) [Coxiella burnetii CbuK_Q154]|nr:peroxiredoxin reductase (NAD(P)H) [Coxiella burnetii CbuK_Q154]